ncbi:MAG: hypothetical protein KAR13_09170 [Desulfobulbaceae bacterium]|nr:hypothetical protein [Desulfobulbaceae bacterium]
MQTLRAQGRELRSKDITRLSPLVHSNLNVLGRYSFDLSPEVKRGDLPIPVTCQNIAQTKQHRWHPSRHPCSSPPPAIAG